MLTLLCVLASARIIEWMDRPQPIRAKWPHLDALAMTAVLVPASLFWFVYFARYWRGRAEIARFWRPIIAQPVKSLLWLVVVFELYLLFFVANSPSVH